MSHFARYIDDAITKGIVRNDSDLAARIGVNKSTISRWRSNKTAPTQAEAEALADLLNIPLGKLLAEAELQRAPSLRAKREWEKIAAMYSRLAASIALAFATLFFSHSPEIQAASTTYDAVNAGNTNYRGFWNRLRNAWTRLAGRWRAAAQPPRFAGS